MQRLFLIILILAFGVTSADARRRKHRIQGYFSYMYIVPRAAPVMPRGGQSYVLRPRPGATVVLRPRPGATVPPFDEPHRPLKYSSPADLVPPDWQLQSADPSWKGQRFLSPDGRGWFTLYATAAEQNAIAAHMKEVAFVDGEEITYIGGERNWIAVSGFKGDRIFYRKAVLACAGERWHHVAFEYPAAAKRKMDEFIKRASEMVHLTQNQGCETPVSNQ
jgi:hypothetical protein